MPAARLALGEYTPFESSWPAHLNTASDSATKAASGSEIRDIGTRIDGSLLGRNVRIVKTDTKPKAYRFMLGDNSEVDIT